VVSDVAAPTTCDCRCHWTDVGDVRAAAQHGGTLPVPPAMKAPDRTDPVAATLACAGCRSRHAVALLNRGTWRHEVLPDDWHDPDPPKEKI